MTTTQRAAINASPGVDAEKAAEAIVNTFGLAHTPEGRRDYIALIVPLIRQHTTYHALSEEERCSIAAARQMISRRYRIGEDLARDLLAIIDRITQPEEPKA